MPIPRSYILTNVAKGIDESEPLYPVSQNANQYSYVGEQSGSSFKKSNLQVPYDPATLLLGRKQREMGIHSHGEAHIHSSIIQIAKQEIKWKCSSADEWLNKMTHLCVHATACYSETCHSQEEP